MTHVQSIALACVAMVALTATVAVRLLLVRVREMREQRIHPQKIATSLQIAERLHNVQASDNFRNLFEVPVLFYALCTLLIASNNASALFSVAAWLFVLLRCTHSLIHCTYNKVMHRFYAFAASSTVLVLMWAAFAVALLRQSAS